ncbi:MAG: DNA repair protein RadA [Candidatus Omnitrophica bacterium CG_4_10_14_0_2_um_filter_44_9]|nr:MAG: DNA repair protein RadA [Candidatus Omnitrophica bacterium CG_4_10_14_0_8_um_filter_44_12]PIZ84277.1 MAG: DNA repair protein RadA [Candidatus Omnitrophica bacterium CG_4_10_14_0_2_um_filter_44_9]
MAKIIQKFKIVFICQNCGFSSPRWLGKCPDCSNWNTFVEEEVSAKPRSAAIGHCQEPVLLSSVKFLKEDRTTIDIAELDRVLGSGIVKGCVVLIGGDPGIGKSTISLQLGHRLAQKGKKILYVSGEESVQQTKLRADRLGARSTGSLYIVNATDIDVVIGFIKKLLPDVVVIDSIQVVYAPSLSSSAGSISQVRECANILTQLAKQSGISIFLIGHVTKEGQLAGPRVLEHIVDTVLYFEGERFSNYRVLRAIKNRFGSTNEIGVFEMTQEGLIEVKNPSNIFLAQRPCEASGSVVVPILEGSRPILVEVQALVTKANFGVTRRKAQGIDYNRLSLLVAVLEKRLSLKLFDKDVFVNVVGGMKIEDPAVDMAVCLAVASSCLDKIIDFDTVALGEIGLASEARSVANITMRVNESKKLGFKKCILPRSNYETVKAMELGGMKLVPVDDLKGAINNLWRE